MSEPLIHINKKYHVPLNTILKVLQKKSGRVWVYYQDKNGQTKIAVAKHEGRTMVHIINQYLTVLFRPTIILEKE